MKIVLLRATLHGNRLNIPIYCFVLNKNNHILTDSGFVWAINNQNFNVIQLKTNRKLREKSG